MRLEYYPYSAVSQLSKRDVKFQMEPDLFNDFIGLPFDIDSFAAKISERRSFPIDRDLLSSVILEQYKSAGVENIPNSQIEALAQENTYTVVTAHQPSLLTGPLYFIHKIISVINLAERLNAKYEEHIVPVFIIGSEDHDFEEVNHFSLFGKQMVWENAEGGAVGRMSTESLMPLLDEVYQILGDSDNAKAIANLIATSFSDVESYNQAVFRLVHQLFHQYNIVLLVTDDRRLKASFGELIKKEVFERPSQNLILKAQGKLANLGIKGQAHAREINFFYLQEGRRDRIEFDGQEYIVLGTELSFSEQELSDEIESYPERFSPNVVMRPVYQEFVLPNLAYLGGGGEIAYWTERKKQFAVFETSFPILIRRNSVLWISGGDLKQLKKYGIEGQQVFDSDEEWVQDFIRSSTTSELEFSAEYDKFQDAYEMLAAKAKTVDPNLAKSIQASGVKAFKSFEQLSSRLLRTEKEKHETDVKKIRKLHNRLFPGGSLQERKDNFIPFYLKYGENFISTLKSSLDPFNPGFLVIVDEN